MVSTSEITEVSKEMKGLLEVSHKWKQGLGFLPRTMKHNGKDVPLLLIFIFFLSVLLSSNSLFSIFFQIQLVKMLKIILVQMNDIFSEYETHLLVNQTWH